MHAYFCGAVHSHCDHIDAVSSFSCILIALWIADLLSKLLRSCKSFTRHNTEIGKIRSYDVLTINCSFLLQFCPKNAKYLCKHKTDTAWMYNRGGGKLSYDTARK